jgi:hypothetical protein
MAQGMQTTYVGTLPQKTVISDRILMIEPMEAPLVAALGLNNDSKFKFINTPGKSYEWLEDTYSAISTTGNDTDLTNDSTATTITVADGSLFQPGDVIQADSEFMWVSAVSTNDLTVTRDYGGALSTQATHASDVTMYLRSRARLEGASANDSHFTEPTSGTNYSFILQKTIKISRTDAKIQRYGISDLLEYEKDKKTKELMRDLARKPYYGVRGAGSATTPRDAGGFDTFITTNATAAASAALTQKMIEDAVESCWNNGGNPTLLVCGAWAKRKIVSFYEESVRTERSETMGGVTINKVLTALGLELNILVDRYCPTNKLWILDPEYLGYITIDDLFYEDLAKTGDWAGYGQIVGEYGFVVAHEKAHAIISGFSTTA